MNTRILHSILLAAVILFPTVAAPGQDKPSDPLDEAVRLLEQAKREFESALAMAERQNKALITTIQSQAQTIADLKRQLADCQARLPGESSSSVPRLGIFTGTVRPALLTEFIKEGAVHIHLLAHHQIGYPRIDEDLLRTSIESMIPVDEEVYACIDMEGAYLTPLMECAVGSAEYEAAADEYIKAMTIAKEMRPKAKWTWWAFPWQSRWTHDTDRAFHTLSRKEYEAEARHILRHARLNSLPDWFTPDGYDFWLHPPEAEKWRRVQQSSLKARLDFTRRIAGDKPILVSTSPRRYVSAGYDLLPIDDWYTDQIAVSLASGADGMVWWGADQWYFSVGRIPAEEIDPKTPQVQARRYFDALARRQFEHYRKWLSPE